MNISDEDEDDKFLYGSDEEQTESKPETGLPESQKRDIDEVETTTEAEGASKKQKVEETPPTLSTTTDSPEDNSEYSDSESDSDVEIIVSRGSNTSRLDAKSIIFSSTHTPGVIPTGPAAVPAAPSGDSISIASDSTSQIKKDESASAGTTTEGESETKPGTAQDMAPGSLDLDKDGLFDGEPMTQIDPEVLKEKPWRKQGVDISDYFNYGFNEYTWMEYLNRQEKRRQEFNPRKILMGLMSLQQKGKIDPITGQNKSMSSNMPAAMFPAAMDPSMNRGNGRNAGGNAPPMMNPFPMFGGFPPFMPGMMPNMNQQQGKGKNQQPPKK